MNRNRTLLALVAVALAGATVFTANRLRVAQEQPYDIAFVPRASVLRVASLGHETLAANLYWLRAVQYIGEPRANARGWDKLYPVVELVTDLDPGHGYAYQVAGTMLGTLGRIQESNAILEKGMERVPDRYILPFLRAFNAFYYEGDFAAAGRFVEIAARTPGAPAHLRQNVLAYYVKGNRAEAAIAFLTQSHREAKDPETRKAVEEQLRQAVLERDALSIEGAMERYRARHGVLPPALQLLVTEGLLPSIPADPYGGHYVIGSDGRVHSSVNPYRFARPQDTGRKREPGVDNSSRPLEMRVP